MGGMIGRRSARRVSRFGAAGRRYGELLRSHATIRVERVVQEVADDAYAWGYFLAWTVGLGALIVGVVRLVQTFTLDGPAVLGWLAVSPGLFLTAAGVAVLVWAAWHIHLDPDHLRPYVVLALSAFFIICVAIETFAGLTTLLVEQGHLASRVHAGSSLWAAERYYVWQLLDSIPALDGTRTLDWHEPGFSPSRLSGSLLLAFRVLLIVPMVHLAVASYRYVTNRWTSHVERNRHRPRRHQQRREVPAKDIGNRAPPPPPWVAAMAMVGCAVGAYVALALLIAPSSFVMRWVTEWTAEPVHVLGRDVAVAWVPVGLQWLVLVVLTSQILSLLELFADSEFLAPSSLVTIAGALVALVAFLAVVTFVIAGVLIALHNMGVGSVEPTLPAGHEASSAIQSVLWPLADSVPLLDVPGSFNWSLHYRFVDHWSGGVLLVHRLVVLAVLVIPVAGLMRVWAQMARPPGQQDGELDVPHQVLTSFSTLQSELDEARRLILENAAARRAMSWGEISDLSLEFQIADLLRTARRRRRELDELTQRSRRMFGAGDISEEADAALSALERRFASLRRLLTNPPVPWDNGDLGEQVAQDEASRLEAENHAERFRSAVQAAFHDALPGPT